MKKLRLATVLTFSLWTIAAGSTPVWCQDEKKSPSRAILYSASYTPIYQFETDLENGGRFQIHHHALQLGFMRPVKQRFRMGLGVGYHIAEWDFQGQPTVLGASAWNTVHRFGIRLPLFYASGDQWMLGVTPAIEFAGEPGAEMLESLSYGGVVSVSRPLGPRLSLGLGFGVFMQPEDTTLFPFIAVDWKIHSQFRLTNPFPAGPAGPAGLELVYAPSQDWELGAGIAYRTQRFRLDKENAVPNGIAENESLVSFLRVQRKLKKGVHLDLAGGLRFDGKLTVENSSGNEVGSNGYDAVPFIALTFSGKF